MTTNCWLLGAALGLSSLFALNASAQDAPATASPEPAAAAEPAPSESQAAPLPLEVTTPKNYEKALELLREREYAQAAELLRVLAERGFGPAQYQLGQLHEDGTGVVKNPTLAWTWYRRATEKQHEYSEEARYRVGRMFEDGEGVPINNGEALRFYLLAAEKGHEEGMLSAGRLLIQGRGARLDLQRGVDWLKKAAALANPEALELLDELSEQGQIRPVDPPGEVLPTNPRAQAALDFVKEYVRSFDPRFGLPPMPQSVQAKPIDRDRPVISLGAPMRVLTREKDIVVFLPRMEVRSSSRPDAGAIKVGTVQVAVADPAAETLDLAVRIPSKIRFQNFAGATVGAVLLTSQRLKADWSKALRVSTKAEFTAESAQFVGALPVSVEFGRITYRMEWEPGPAAQGTRTVYDFTELFELRDTQISLADLRREGSVTIGRLSFFNQAAGVDLPAALDFARHYGFDWRTGSFDLPRLVQGLQQPLPIPKFLASASQEFLLDEVAVKDRNNVDRLVVGQVALKGGMTSDEAGALGTANFDLTLANIQDLASEGGVALPKRAGLRFSIREVPIRGLVQRMVDAARQTSLLTSGFANIPEDRLFEYLVGDALEIVRLSALENGTHLRLDHGFVEGEAYAVYVNAILQPVRQGEMPIDLDISLQVAGFEQAVATLLEAARDRRPGANPRTPRRSELETFLTPDRIAALRDSGTATQTQDGRQALAYNLQLTDEGTFTLNGQSLLSVLGLEGPAPGLPPPSAMVPDLRPSEDL